MPQKSVVMAAAWLEIIVGAILLASVNAPSRLLFVASPGVAGVLLGRFLGVALVALGVACVPSKSAGPDRSAVRGLAVFNVGMTIFFAWVAIATTFRGILLWPAVILHAVLAAALLAQLKVVTATTIPIVRRVVVFMGNVGDK